MKSLYEFTQIEYNIDTQWIVRSHSRYLWKFGTGFWVLRGKSKCIYFTIIFSNRTVSPWTLEVCDDNHSAFSPLFAFLMLCVNTQLVSTCSLNLSSNRCCFFLQSFMSPREDQSVESFLSIVCRVCGWDSAWCLPSCCFSNVLSNFLW